MTELRQPLIRVAVQTATTAAIDVKLQTGTVNESVQVSADAPTIQTESADIGTVVGTIWLGPASAVCVLLALTALFALPLSRTRELVPA